MLHDRGEQHRTGRADQRVDLPAEQTPIEKVRETDINATDTQKAKDRQGYPLSELLFFFASTFEVVPAIRARICLL
ncbi:hypothetical protein [Gloeobacter violaceus]|uniref:hypothetical protein n=1 Tax=Gloeobacter violaceus TaxID=33072 RepID=UPI0013E8E3A8|nr:hypothetical protein [Gloeobacter violaceus]